MVITTPAVPMEDGFAPRVEGMTSFNGGTVSFYLLVTLRDGTGPGDRAALARLLRDLAAEIESPPAK